jgi:hypothetical protein
MRCTLVLLKFAEVSLTRGDTSERRIFAREVEANWLSELIDAVLGCESNESSFVLKPQLR